MNPEIAQFANVKLKRMTDYYCPQTKFAKVMFSQVSICPLGGGGGRGSQSLSKEGSPSRGSLSTGSLCPWGVSVHRGLCLGGSLSRWVSAQGVPVQGSLSGRLPYGNVRAVLILLECILVFN